MARSGDASRNRVVLELQGREEVSVARCSVNVLGLLYLRRRASDSRDAASCTAERKRCDVSLRRVLWPVLITQRSGSRVDSSVEPARSLSCGKAQPRGGPCARRARSAVRDQAYTRHASVLHSTTPSPALPGSAALLKPISPSPPSLSAAQRFAANMSECVSCAALSFTPAHFPQRSASARPLPPSRRSSSCGHGKSGAARSWHDGRGTCVPRSRR
jgi:hypothetical protein